MTLERPILCATDFSPHGERASVVAAALARALGAPLVLVHVMDTGADAETMVTAEIAQAARIMRERVQARVESARVELVREAAGLAPLRCATRVLDGRPAEAIAAHADAIDAHVVVIGAHGATRAMAEVRHAMLGSTAERLLHTLKRPVLVAPSSPTDVVIGAAPWVVGVALDHAAEQTLDVAFALAARTQTPLNAIHVVAVDEADERPATKRFDHEVMNAERRTPLGSEPLTWVVRGPVAEMLVSFAKDVRGVLVIGTHGPGTLERIALGSVAAQTLHRADGPILVVPVRP